MTVWNKIIERIYRILDLKAPYFPYFKATNLMHVGDSIDESSHYSALFNEEKLGCIKWSHYSSIYDEIFHEYRDKQNLNILEIGVQFGGSLHILREYFHPSCSIIGVDVDTKVEKIEIERVKILVGDITSNEFIGKLLEQVQGKFDIIIDDASHKSRKQAKTLELLFPHLAEHGIFVVEDVEHSYFLESTPTYFLGNSFVNYALRTVHTLNSQFRKTKVRRTLEINPYELWSVTFYPQIVVFRKRKRTESRVVHTGENYKLRSNLIGKIKNRY